MTTVIAWPIIDVLIKENFFINLQKSFEEILFNLSLEKLFLSIDIVFKNFVEIIAQNGLVVHTIFTIVFDMVIFLFLRQYASLALHQNIGGYMSSLTKYGFVNAYVSNFGKATVMALVKLITTLLFNVFIWASMYFFASMLYQKIGVFAIIIAFFLLILLLSIKYAIFAGWEAAYLIHDEKVFVALKRSIIAVSKKYFKVLSNFLVLITILLLLNMLALTLTAGAALLLTLPLTTLSLVVLEEVTYRELLGMRYYIDSERIVTPKKLEQQDSFRKVKDLI